MENQRRPTLNEIYQAIYSEDTSPDWDRDILTRADPTNIFFVRGSVRLYGHRELEDYFESLDRRTEFED